MDFNVSVIKLVFVASTVNLLFNSNSTQPILTLTQNIDTTSNRPLNFAEKLRVRLGMWMTP
jgi:hypothetical protein